MRVILRLRPSADLAAADLGPRGTAGVADLAGPCGTARVAELADTRVPVAVADLVGLIGRVLPEVELDPGFAPLTVPASGGEPSPLGSSPAAEDVCVLVRGTMPDDAALAAGRPGEVDVYADPFLTHEPPGADGPPVGDWHDVERLLNVAGLHAEGLDGDGVPLALLGPGLDTELGAMCAFGALIAAPHARLVDVPMPPTGFGDPGPGGQEPSPIGPAGAARRAGPGGGVPVPGLLSDAVAGLARLLAALEARPGESRALVVTGSWTSSHPDSDLPPGHPGNYSGNPAHPFHLLVAALDRAGADVVFPAGGDGPIEGAGSHPKALSVGAVDVNGHRLRYSGQGPGRLSARKPDVCAYAHFRGSEVFGTGRPDTGACVAAAVTAGLVAAVRTRWPASRLPPAELRALLRRTAEEHSEAGFDYDHGYGTVDPSEVIAALQGRAVPVA